MKYIINEINLTRFQFNTYFLNLIPPIKISQFYLCLIKINFTLHSAISYLSVLIA